MTDESGVGGVGSTVPSMSAMFAHHGPLGAPAPVHGESDYFMSNGASMPPQTRWLQCVMAFNALPVHEKLLAFNSIAEDLKSIVAATNAMVFEAERGAQEVKDALMGVSEEKKDFAKGLEGL